MEVVVRAAAVYVFLWIVTRALGRSTLGELSTFQLLMYVVMGDLIQQGVTQQDYSVTGAVLAISTFAVITSGLAYANRRWRSVRPITHGTAVRYSCNVLDSYVVEHDDVMFSSMPFFCGPYPFTHPSGCTRASTKAISPRAAR